jgi:hypothetical protein
LVHLQHSLLSLRPTRSNTVQFSKSFTSSVLRTQIAGVRASFALSCALPTLAAVVGGGVDVAVQSIKCDIDREGDQRPLVSAPFVVADDVDDDKALTWRLILSTVMEQWLVDTFLRSSTVTTTTVFRPDPASCTSSFRLRPVAINWDTAFFNFVTFFSAAQSSPAAAATSSSSSSSPSSPSPDLLSATDIIAVLGAFDSTVSLGAVRAWCYENAASLVVCLPSVEVTTSGWPGVEVALSQGRVFSLTSPKATSFFSPAASLATTVDVLESWSVHFVAKLEGGDDSSSSWLQVNVDAFPLCACPSPDSTPRQLR